MSLPDSWVDRIFSKLAVAYGQRFMGLYAGLDPADVKADWARTLACYQQNPDALAYGLEHLPADNPPNALQFRDLCRRRPDAPVPKLPAPSANPEFRAQALEALRHLGTTFGRPKNPKRWAYRLKDREERGDSLTQFQRDAWREALHQPVTSENLPEETTA